MSTRRAKLPGVLISFEGGEGGGKSTQLKRLSFWLQDQGLKVLVTREPGGSELGKKIREWLLDPNGTVCPRTELLLYEADRAQHVDTVILPALREGKVVLTDRFADSATVYQGVCRGFGTAWTEKLNAFATGGLFPDLTLVLDVPEKVGLERARIRTAGGTGQLDRLEKEKLSFHRAVRKGFLKLAKQNPRRMRVIAGTATESEVWEAIQKEVGAKLTRMGIWKRKAK